jgi:hypothetical protein
VLRYPVAAERRVLDEALRDATDRGLIAEAAADLADYQRLTAEGKLGEAGQKLDALKRVIEQLNARRR